ncbi:hypothetical protein HDU83_000026 [Entophlyctis luteolus]|nr:hypothetical protein HDU83_000026 [Entophlyctis luteolus]
MPAFFRATWPRHAVSGLPAAVTVKGSFDSWSSGIPMVLAAGANDDSAFVSASPTTPYKPHPFSSACARVSRASKRIADARTALLPLGSLKPGEKLFYKYIVDGVWRVSPNYPAEYDNAGNENNVYVVGSTVSLEVDARLDLSVDNQSPMSVTTPPPKTLEEFYAVEDSSETMIIQSAVAVPLLEKAQAGDILVCEKQDVSSTDTAEFSILPPEAIDTSFSMLDAVIKVDGVNDGRTPVVPLSVVSVESIVDETQAVAVAVEPSSIDTSVAEPVKSIPEDVVSSPEFTLKNTSETTGAAGEEDSDGQKDLLGHVHEPSTTASPQKASDSTGTPPSRRQSMPAPATASSRTSTARDPRFSMTSMESIMSGGSSTSSPPKTSTSPRSSPRNLLMRGVAFFKKDRSTGDSSASGDPVPGSPRSADSLITAAPLGKVAEELDEIVVIPAVDGPPSGVSAVDMASEDSKNLGGAEMLKSLFGVGANKKKKSGKNRRKK